MRLARKRHGGVHPGRSGMFLLPLLFAGAVASQYAPPELDQGYQSSALFKARGLQPLYDAAKAFISAVTKEDPLPPGLLVWDGRQLQVNLEPSNLLDYYSALVAVLVVCVLIILVIPIAGVFRCCCCCCSICCCCCGGGDNRKAKSDQSLVCLGLLVILTVAILLGAAFAFMANEYMDDGVRQLPGEIRVWSDDVRLFIKNTKTEVETILQINYGEMSNALNAELEDGLNQTNGITSEVADTLPFDYLKSLVHGLKVIRTDLEGVESTARHALALSNSIFADLREIGDSLEVLCSSSALQCPEGLQELASQINSIAGNPINDLPEVGDSIQAILKYTDGDFETQLNEGREKVDEIETQIQEQLKNVILTINSTIDEVGVNLMSSVNDIIRPAENSVDDILNTIDTSMDTLIEPYVKEFNHYRYYAELTVCLILLMIVALITLGLLCGAFSDHPAYYSLSIATFLIYLTTSVFMLIVTLLFLVGLVGEVVVCDPMRHPETNQIVGILDEVLSSLLYDVTGDPMLQNYSLTLSSSIAACHRNEGMYEVLDLNSVVDLSEVLSYADDFSFDEYLTQVNDLVSIIANIVILSPELDQNLEDLEESPLSRIDYSTFENEIILAKEALSQINASVWADVLTEMGDSNPSINVDTEVDKLRGMQLNIDDLRLDIETLDISIAQLSIDLSLNHSSFAEAVKVFRNQMRDFGPYIQSQAQVFNELANITATKCLDEVKGYLNYVVTYTQTEAIRCGPLSGVYNATNVAICDKILSPLNGFWASVGWNVLLSIPILIVVGCISSRR